MNPTILGAIGPGCLNQVPTLTLNRRAGRLTHTLTHTHTHTHTHTRAHARACTDTVAALID